MARIPEAELERLRGGISVERLVESAGVELKPAGKDLLGRCPFHEDREASLVITPSKNLWHCFACQIGGGPIDWMMKAKGVSFRHAVELLREGALDLPVGPVKGGRIRVLPAPVSFDANDQALLAQAIDYYHERLKGSPEALSYLAKRGVNDASMIERFKLGFADRTLGLRLPEKNRKAGGEIRARLQKLGLWRESGHEHFNGSVVIPIIAPSGEITEVYGRKITPGLRAGTPDHLYLPGPHRGVWNESAFVESKEIILCEALLDALTFWCAGFRNVTASYGIEGFTPDHLAAFRRHGTERVLIAYDRDEAGDRAAEKLAAQLNAAGLDCYRILFPKGMDANEYALKVTPAAKSLGLVIRKAQWLGKGAAPGRGEPKPISTPIAAATVIPGVSEPAAKGQIPAAPVLPVSTVPVRSVELLDAAPGPDALLPASPLPGTALPAAVPQVQGEEIVITLGDRRYRVRGLAKNLAFDVLMKVNVLVSRAEGCAPQRGCTPHGAFHVDTLDLYSVRARTAFITQAAVELQVKDEVIRHDLGRVLRQLESLQEQTIANTLQPKDPTPAIPAEEQQEALALLKDPQLLNRLLADFARCGVVGEETNKLIGYLAATSRKLDAPLAVMVQSSSAAGKSSLMEAVLSFMPEEDKVQYSAMTGQSLFYMGSLNLKHKILALAEEAGAARASYALKLLQSEGVLSIASTGKDPQSGKLVTHEYRVEGPVMIFSTTTAIDHDEELLNRCLTLGVDESREQTRAILQLQRQKRTLEGLFAKQAKAALLKQHQNAQRLLRPLAVRNPYADALTFPDERTRLRRDHEKYLTLIDTIALLHQHQRVLRTAEHEGQRIEYIEVTLDDIQIANRLAHEALGRSLDELSPQTRRLLELVTAMVEKHCAAQAITRADYRFSRREVREATSWSDFQVKMHMHKLEELEYVLVHRGGRGQSFVYELLYDGAGRDAQPFLMGLIDVAALKEAYDEKKEHQNGQLEHPRSPQVVPLEHGSSEPGIAPNPLNKATLRETPKKNGKTTSWDESASIPSYVPPLAAAGL